MYLQMVDTQVAGKQDMGATHVTLERIERFEEGSCITSSAAVLK